SPTPPELSSLSLHDALPIWAGSAAVERLDRIGVGVEHHVALELERRGDLAALLGEVHRQDAELLDRLGVADLGVGVLDRLVDLGDRKSTRLNSSHVSISYAV